MRYMLAVLIAVAAGCGGTQAPPIECKGASAVRSEGSVVTCDCIMADGRLARFQVDTEWVLEVRAEGQWQVFRDANCPTKG